MLDQHTECLKIIEDAPLIMHSEPQLLGYGWARSGTTYLQSMVLGMIREHVGGYKDKIKGGIMV